MSKTWVIVKREYLTRVKTKGFIIGTVILPFFIILMGVLPTLLTMAKPDQQQKLLLIDFTNKLAASVKESLEKEKVKGDVSRYLVEIRAMTSSEFETQKESLEQQVLKGDYLGFVVIHNDVFDSNKISMYLKNVSNFSLNENVRRAVSDNVRDLRITESGLNPDTVNLLTRRVDFQTYKVVETGSRKESQEGAFFVSYILIFFLYMALIFYGVFVMRGVIEDKNSRVVEVIISSVKPHELMAGKILGIGGAGLTQFLIWALTIGLFSLYGVYLVGAFAPDISGIQIPKIPVMTLIYFLLYFVLGFFLYATLYAAIGAMVENESDAQSMQWPVMIFLVIGFMLMFYILPNPESNLAIVLSIFPLFAPLLMFLRISVEAASLGEILISIVLLILTIWGAIWLVGRIFKVGILMYGKRPNLPELMKWIKQA